MASLTIEQWPIGRLIPYENNPRKNDDAVPRMVTVIREFGFQAFPVLAKSTGDLVDGHLRLKAAMALGLDTVPVITVDDMSLEQVRAFRISRSTARQRGLTGTTKQLPARTASPAARLVRSQSDRL